MKRAIVILLLPMVFFITEYGFCEIVVVIYHKGTSIRSVAQCFSKTKISRILQYCPPGDSRNFEFWVVPDSCKVQNVGNDGVGWTVKLTSVWNHNDSLHVGNADSVAVYDKRFSK